MFINKDSILIVANGHALNVGRYITQAKYEYNKLWSQDSGRNLAGTQSGTLIGIFPKIILSFRKLTKTELETIAPILDSANQSFTYYDPNKKRSVTMTTYTGDWSVASKRIISNTSKNETFEVSFISVRKR